MGGIDRVKPDRCSVYKLSTPGIQIDPVVGRVTRGEQNENQGEESWEKTETYHDEEQKKISGFNDKQEID